MLPGKCFIVILIYSCSDLVQRMYNTFMHQLKCSTFPIYRKLFASTCNWVILNTTIFVIYFYSCFALYLFFVFYIFQHCSSDVDEDAIKKVFEESGTVAKFKFFEYVIMQNIVHSIYICISYAIHNDIRMHKMWLNEMPCLS